MTVKWEHISEINFMPVDLPSVQWTETPTASIAQSTQGIYKGIIKWNYKFPLSIYNEQNLNSQLQQTQQIIRNKSAIEMIAQNQKADNNSFSKPQDIAVNMSGIGSVVIPWSQFQQLTIIPFEELKLPSYADFKEPQELSGEVFTQKGASFKGRLAYNLNASLTMETLTGRNNELIYRIPFGHILSIEPKNYIYSFITLRNGSQLSLGETRDVNWENQGIIVFPDNGIPVYIAWEEIKKITFN